MPVDLPLIDMHTHQFNSRHLPMENVVRGRGGEMINLLDKPKEYALIKLFNLARRGAQLIPFMTQWSGRSITVRSLARRVDLLVLATPVDDAEFQMILAKANGWKQWTSTKTIGDLLLPPHITQAQLDKDCRCEWRKTHPGRPDDNDEIAVLRFDRLRMHITALIYIGARLAMEEDRYAFDHTVPLWLHSHITAHILPRRLVEHAIANTYAADVKNLARIVEDLLHGESSVGMLPSDRPELSLQLDWHQPWHRGPSGLSLPGLWQTHEVEGIHHSSMAQAEEWLWFLIHLTRTWSQSPATFRAENPDIDLAIYHPMNMGPSFHQKPGHMALFPKVKRGGMMDFGTEQMEKAREIESRSDGRIIHFVAFSPFDSIGDPKCPDRLQAPLPDSPEDYPKALRQVHDAIQKGAWGVKFYPPMGYRPTNNDPEVSAATDKPDDRSPFIRSSVLNWHNKLSAPERVRQWEARYQQPGWSGAKLDAVNDMLFTYCERHQIPIFTHCNTGEMRVDPAAQRYAHPRFWQIVLERHPGLRLCLGHAGNYAFWCDLPAGWDTDGKVKPGTRCLPEWGIEVARLCARYPNVYCEMGIHEQMADAGYAARYTVVVDDLLNHPDGQRSKALFGETRPRYSLSSKMMYGTDWFMPIEESPASYLDGFLRVYRRGGPLEAHRAGFFCGNAAKFLRLEEQIKKSPLVNKHPEQKAQLEALLARIRAAQ